HRRFDIDEAGDVAAWPREACDEPAADWIGDHHEHYRDGLGLIRQCLDDGGRAADQHIGLKTDEFLRKPLHPVHVRRAVADIEVKIAAFNPSMLGKPLPESPQIERHLSVVLGVSGKEANAPHWLLRARRERPYRCSPNECDELAPPHLDPPLN